MCPLEGREVWFPQVPMLRTIDGGKTLEYMKGFHHGDHHDLWIDPTNPNYQIVGNDGGIFAFGDAEFFGSVPGAGVASKVVAMAPERHDDMVAVVSHVPHLTAASGSPSAAVYHLGREA